MKTVNEKVFDLEERTFNFAKKCREFVKKVKKSIINLSDCEQLVRASGSSGANYIEANEGLGKKDFIMRVKISRKEAKESSYWLRLIDSTDEETSGMKLELIQEAKELTLIFNSIIMKLK